MREVAPNCAGPHRKSCGFRGRTSAMPLCLGIDGGGTKTECAVGDERSILGRATGESAKVQRVGEENARQALRSVIGQACAAAGIEAKAIQSTCIGIAGAAREPIAEFVRRTIGEVVPGVVEVVGDMAIALEAAFEGGPGVVVIAGTGSIAYGRNERGETARAGGWGPVVSDEGSGDWIGKQAVAAAMRAHDGGRMTQLLPTVMNTWHIATRSDLFLMANAYPPPDFAGLVPAVIANAEAGDLLAREVLANAGTELAKLAGTVIRRLWPGPCAVKVAMVGGVFRNVAPVRESFRKALLSLRPDAALAEGIVDPVLGALALARKAVAAGRAR